MAQPRCPSEVGVLDFHGRPMAKDDFGHLFIAMEGGPVKRRGLMLSFRIDRKAAFEHEADRFRLIVAGRMSHLPAIGIRKPLCEVRMLRTNRSHSGFVAQPTGLDEPDRNWAALEK